MNNKKILATIFSLSLSLGAFAQTDDPVLMHINGVPVTRSEFEYSYNKNNSEGVIDKKTVKEYVDLFVNYKLKVAAAEEARYDTLESFKTEFATYRDQQIRPAMITDEDVEKKAFEIYKETQERIDSMGGLVKSAHILVMARQNATDEQVAAAQSKADSIYNVLRANAFNEKLFGELAKKHSEDPGSAKNGGELPWFSKGQTLPEFDEKVFSLQAGETSEPVKTSAGFHIIQVREKQMFHPFDSVRASIMRFIDQRGIRDQIINQRLSELAKEKNCTPDEVLAEKREQLVAEDSDLANLIREYHDGLLLIEISNRLVWEKASNDEAGLAKFFKKNKKKYAWDEPRFKGMAFRTRDIADVEPVKASVKGLAFADWNEKLRSTFNNDSVLRIRVEKGVFKKGDNAIIDKYEFKVEDAKIKDMKGYPNTASYGKLITKPEDYNDVRGLVVADYQDALEKEWDAELRKKYTVKIDEAVLETVNKH